MKKTSIFDFTDYKQYLRESLPTSGPERGIRARLARELQCKGAYISQVLNGPMQFSLEHAARINRFMGHSREEGDFFILLVQFARAGSKELETVFSRQITEQLEDRKVIARRLGLKQALGHEEQSIYYSSWMYAAVHVMLLIPKFRTKTALSEALHVPLPQITEVLEFLVRSGLAIEKNGEFKTGEARIHLPSTSVLARTHHASWRMRAIHSLDRGANEDIHYSGPVTVSHENAEKIRKIILDAIAQLEVAIQAPNEEAGFGLCLDFFGL